MSEPTVTIESIVGNEGYGKAGTPYEALVKFYAAFSTKNNELMAECWDTAVPVSNLNQLGGIIRSRDGVLGRYAAIFAAPFKVQAEFFDYHIQEEGDFATVVGREKGTFENKGEVLHFATRDTRLFRRGADGQWRHVHHHGSFEDPEIMKGFHAAAGVKKSA